MHRYLVLWLQLGITVLAVLSMSACGLGEKNDEQNGEQNEKTAQSSEGKEKVHVADHVTEKKTDKKKSSENRSQQFYVNYGDNIYQILLAEYHYQQGDYEKSSYLYSVLLADSYVADNSEFPSSSDADESSGIASNKGSSIALFKRATELAIKIEDHDQALRSAQQWKKLDPDSSAVNQFLVLLYQKSGQYEKSAEVLADIVKTYPAGKNKAVDVAVALLEQQAEAKDAYQTLKHYIKEYAKKHGKEKEGDTAYYVAIFAMRAKLYEEVLLATEDLDQIKDTELKQKVALLRIKVYTAMGKPEKALGELKTLIAEAADLSTRQTYARIMASLGKSEQAVAMLDQSYEKHPENAELLLDIIAINLGEEKYEESLPYLDKLQTLKDQETNAHYFRGIVLESLDRFTEALSEYTAIDKDKQSMQVYSRIAFVKVKAEGLENALSFLHVKQDQHEDVSSKRELYLLESEILREAKSFEKALVANKKAEKLAPKNLDILYSQALLYEDADQIDKSEEQLLKILNIDNNHSSALNALGYLLSVHTKRFDEAYIYIKKAYDLKPDDPAIIDSLGWVSYRKGDLKGAEKYLRLAYQKLKDPEVASHLVEVLTKQGHKEEAANLLTEMLKKHPENKKLIKAQAFIKKNP